MIGWGGRARTPAPGKDSRKLGPETWLDAEDTGTLEGGRRGPRVRQVQEGEWTGEPCSPE